MDAKGNICITDLGNFMVLKFSPGGVLTMVVGNGAKGYSGNGVRRPARRFPLPRMAPWMPMVMCLL
jgi:hypothetical protein